MEDLESELSEFIDRVESGWICAEFKGGESNCVPSGGYFTSLFKLFFSQVGSCRINFESMRCCDS